MTIRLPAEVKDRLLALADLSGVPAYRILQNGFEIYWQRTDPRLQEGAKAIVRLKKSL